MKVSLTIFTLILATALQAQTAPLQSKVYTYSDKKSKQISKGVERKSILEGSSTDLSHVKIFTETLQPGKAHQPYKNSAADELILIKEGSVQTSINGKTQELGPGSVAFAISNDEHGFKNTSSLPVTYYILQFSPQAADVKERERNDQSFMQDWKYFTVTPTDKGESRQIFDLQTKLFKRFDIHATALNPDISSHPPHTHRSEEIILMIKGNGEMQLGETQHKAQTGDVIFVNANDQHAFTNTGQAQCGYYAIQWHN